MTTRRKATKKATKKAKSTRKAAKTTKKAAKKAAKSTKRAVKAAPRRSPRAALSVVTSSKQTAKQRIDALGDVTTAICENDESFQKLLNILRDQKEPIKVRLATLQTLQGASFSVITFEPCRAEYMATLRE